MIQCSAASCGRPAPPDRQWRLVTVAPGDLHSVFSCDPEADACPVCRTPGSLLPDLFAVLTVDGLILHLDRGAGQRARSAAAASLAPLQAALGLDAFEIVTLDDVDVFKAELARRVRRVAETYAFRTFEIDDLQSLTRGWKGLQGEVLSAMLCGALGMVPGFGFHAATAAGEPPGVEETLKRLGELVADLAAAWTVAITGLKGVAPLDELLVRLIDALPLGHVSPDALTDRIRTFRDQAAEADPERELLSAWFSFEAVQASVYERLGRPNPDEAEWAHTFLRFGMARRLQTDGAALTNELDLPLRRISNQVGPESAWNGIARILAPLLAGKLEDETRLRLVEALKEASEAMGWGPLVGEILRKGVRFRKAKGVSEDAESPEDAAAKVLQWVADEAGRDITAALRLLRHNEWYDQPKALHDVMRAIRPGLANDPSMWARALGWFGEKMKLMGSPTLALLLIGELAEDWESDLPAGERRALWTERSNALRLLGRTAEALRIAETVADTLDDAPAAQAEVRRVGWLNVGILLRETGDHDGALHAFRAALDCCTADRNWEVHNSLAACLLEMGRSGEAAEAYARARSLVGGEDRQTYGQGLLISEASAWIRSGDTTRAKQLLLQITDHETLRASAAGPYLSALGALGTSNLTTEQKSAIPGLLARVQASARASDEAGDLLQATAGLTAAAIVIQALDLGDADELWGQAAGLWLQSGQAPPPVVALEIARMAASEDNADTLGAAIAILPESIGLKAGGTLLVSGTVTSLDTLDGGFRRLTEALITHDWDATAVQTVSEIRRNAHWKANRHRSTGDTLLPPQAAISRLKARAPCLVLEWCDLTMGACAVLTTVTRDRFEAEVVTVPAVDLFCLAGQMAVRLDVWHARRAGDPFDHPDWEGFRTWLRDTVRGGGTEGVSHLVVIDHPELGALPYHLALAPDWTVSHASDWQVAAAAIERSAQPRPLSTVGVACAPRSNETAGVREALSASAEATARAATDLGCETRLLAAGKADVDGVLGLLGTYDAVKLICHGQVSTKNHEGVLVLDHEGREPPGDAFGLMQEGAEGHRLGAARISDLTGPGNVVFLAACDSARSTISGLDERTSVATSLLRAGVRSVVAARWTLHVDLGLPVLDDAISRHLAGEPLASALNSAAQAAVARGVPRWQAHVFVLEGAW